MQDTVNVRPLIGCKRTDLKGSDLKFMISCSVLSTLAPIGRDCVRVNGSKVLVLGQLVKGKNLKTLREKGPKRVDSP